MEYLDKLLEKLVLATGVGYNGHAAQVILEALKVVGVTASVNHDGSVHACLEGNGEKGLMLACHLDEIGYIVSRIDDAGRIFVSEIGGADVRILPGQEVLVPLEELFVDVGLKPEVVKRDIHVGDYVAFAAKYRRMGKDLRTAKSLDNRASVACGILVLKEMIKLDHSFHIHFVATSQEEYTGLGASIHAFKLPVDYAVIIDVSHAEHPDLKEHEYFPLDGGPTIVRGATVPQRLYDLLLQTAQSLEIPYQVQPIVSRTGTDADDIAFSRQGIPSCVVGIPLRYMHTPVEVVSLRDIERAARLITGFIGRLEDSVAGGMN
jgi:putative aminopeptidase FrvX